MKFLLIYFFALVCQAGLAQTLLAGFARVQVGGAIASPTVMAFSPDGRIFVAQQTGALRVIKNDALLPTPFVSLSVNSSGERGLIGLALDPDFKTNSFIYLYYTTSTAPLHNRIIRLTANGDVAQSGSEQSILELDNLSSATNHNGGALAFGTDGKLYVAVGDNANTTYPQNLDTYHGKLLRINKDGSAPTDNPWYTPTVSEQRKRIWAYGLRNPYTFSIQPGTGKIFVNDVGQNAVEEINDATTGGRNFGWPTTEGTSTNPGFTNPVYAYNHTGIAPTGCAITGGTFFNPVFTTYPASYIGKYFFQDYCGNWIYSLDFSTTPTVTLFASAIGVTSLSLTTGPDGNLYYLSRGAQALYKITSTNSTSPVIAQQPASTNVPVGDPVTFSVSATGTAPLQYQWQKNGIVINGATGSAYTINSAQLSDSGDYGVMITNIAGLVTSNVAVLTVIANSKPLAQIITPVKDITYVAGTSLGFSGAGSDAEDGILPASAMSWQINFHHDTHKHDEPARNGISQGTFDIPDRGETSANVWFRFILTVRDSKGSIGKDSVDVHPEKSMITLNTSPSGLLVKMDGQPHKAPISIESVEGLKRDISVEILQQLDGVDYEFLNWSHSGATSQTIITPASDITYMANFSPVLGVENGAIAIYPNPASDWLYVPNGVESSISLTDVIGRTWNLPIGPTAGQSAIDVRSLPSGVYILNYSLNQTPFRHKVLIHR